MNEKDKQMLMDIIKESMEKHSNTDGMMDRAMIELFKMYQSAIRAGFNEEQSLQIALRIVELAITDTQKKEQ